jgi:hypothetical protein
MKRRNFIKGASFTGYCWLLISLLRQIKMEAGIYLQMINFY